MARLDPGHMIPVSNDTSCAGESPDHAGAAATMVPSSLTSVTRRSTSRSDARWRCRSTNGWLTKCGSTASAAVESSNRIVRARRRTLSGGGGSSAARWLPTTARHASTELRRARTWPERSITRWKPPMSAGTRKTRRSRSRDQVVGQRVAELGDAGRVVAQHSQVGAGEVEIDRIGSHGTVVLDRSRVGRRREDLTFATVVQRRRRRGQQAGVVECRQLAVEQLACFPLVELDHRT